MEQKCSISSNVCELCCGKKRFSLESLMCCGSELQNEVHSECTASMGHQLDPSTARAREARTSATDCEVRDYRLARTRRTSHPRPLSRRPERPRSLDRVGRTAGTLDRFAWPRREREQVLPARHQ